MSADYSFAGKLREGGTAEALAESFLRTHTSITQVKDVRSDPAWQRQDVDYLAWLATGVMLKVEVKSDAHIARSGNLLFELSHIHFSGNPVVRPGWSVFSAANWLLVWCPASAQLYSFTSDSLRQAVRRYIQRAKADTRVAVVTTDRGWATVNVLVPTFYVEHRKYMRVNGLWQAVN